MMSMSSWVLSIKVILISAGVLSLAVGIKFSIPIAVNGVPAMWSVVLSWMKPPYLYIIINGIIITIAASSRFHHGQSESQATRYEHLISVKTHPAVTFESRVAQPDINSATEETTEAAAGAEVLVSDIEHKIVELKPVIVNGSKIDIATDDDNLAENEAEVETDNVIVHSMLTNGTPPQEMISPEFMELRFPVREIPLVSSRFVHRKPSRTSPEVAGVRALRVAKPKRQETLESTWKMITEGRHVPLTRHLKKSDIWEQHVSPLVNQVPKSETFKERSNYESPARIRKEPSLGQDELNRRVEAFIKKFNEEMRMQRQESLNQYMEMINRGV